MPFHSGEIAVQTRAGVREEAAQVGRVISSTIHPVAVDFIRTQQIAIASTIAPDGTIWASLLAGEPGFMRALDESTIQLNLFAQTNSASEGAISDRLINLLHKNLQSNSQIGLLAIDLSNRRRLRLNGHVTIQHPEKLQLQIQQSFFNCPKYIQTRFLETSAIAPLQPTESHARNTLNSADESWITQADTFFIASANSTQGADASHRGGYPGFVRVMNSHTLLFPDYAGNNMFQTLGNLAVNPRAGLLFVDFDRGHTLQLTGQVTILWDAEQLADFSGAQRLIEVRIDRVIETQNATNLRWKFGEYSPANPA
ncbi:MAG: pyridoxamine 5-phosphate oxidase [Oscillatoriales cyanobacterium RU_3_3]|nr:pyridoxamine 5-phosphate oxidase [Microcoleus sp. SU_5_6]NJM59177.1 pyridoxamine 5-phosphate oxidase [Oscillatoriales cyanobacterium RU_3_3]NJR20911.1 pyridoxamine 5-phosphate oxidase [Richelia sp. CSU_2_1]